MTNNREFIVSIEKFIKQAGEDLDEFTREFPQDLTKAIIEDTPVDTGFLRGSWTAAIDAPDLSHQGQIGTDPSTRIALNLRRAKAGDTIYITNTAKYGPYVEFGTAFIAPRAFVRNNVAKADMIAKNTLKRIKNG